MLPVKQPPQHRQQHQQGTDPNEVPGKNTLFGESINLCLNNTFIPIPIPPGPRLTHMFQNSQRHLGPGDDPANPIVQLFSSPLPPQLYGITASTPGRVHVLHLAFSDFHFSLALTFSFSRCLHCLFQVTTNCNIMEYKHTLNPTTANRSQRHQQQKHPEQCHRQCRQCSQCQCQRMMQA